jgi:RNA polymerase sigma factor (sigma-70 family)
VDDFEAHRSHLHSVARGMLGSAADADDVVQEAWLRWQRTDTSTITNPGGWLTTVVARLSLDQLRARSRRAVEPVPDHADTVDPAHEAELADHVGAAMLVVLDALKPAERLAFVLHDTFGVPFEQIGAALGRSPAAAKQLAMRARQKVRGASAPDDADPETQRAIVDAFLLAARQGDFAGLVRLLHPDAVVLADAAAAQMGAPSELRGADGVAAMFSGRALGAEATTIDGIPGMVWMVNGRPKVAWEMTIVDGTITRIDMLADESTLAEADLAG